MPQGRLIRPHRSTMYVGAAYCYRPSSVVCQSVCRTSEPCRNGWTGRDAVWDLDSGGSKEACIGGGAHWRKLANTNEPFMCGGNAACCKILLTTCTCYFRPESLSCA